MRVPIREYDFVYQMSKLFGKRRKGVIHTAKCPVCGRKNVNIYWQNLQWQCRACCILEKKLAEVRKDEE